MVKATAVMIGDVVQAGTRGPRVKVTDISRFTDYGGVKKIRLHGHTDDEEKIIATVDLDLDGSIYVY
jgi:hypothetical protein